ncbi:Heparinase II/III-like protein [Opitutaceae bacterium TAV1]|nr:Heparinase II/III-like protein [Opitutaceae bacterium TAV1]
MLATPTPPSSPAAAQASAPLNLFSGGHSAESLQALLIPRMDWRPFPPLAERAAWEGANRGMLDAALREAEAKADRPWSPVPATHFLAILRTGDRSAYEATGGEKRRRLMLLMLAELYENKGRFIDPLLNGIWSICEESFWGSPAHLWDSSRRLTGLPDTETPTVDLGASETAAALSWVDYFLGSRLDEISPFIRKRIRHEIRRRVLTPLDNKPDSSHQAWFWLQTSRDGERPNNWNPWIVSNWLTAILLMEIDETERARMCLDALRILDNYVNPYPADGGCDEGPVYWGAATASVHDCAALLNLATRGAFRYVFENEKIREMARFIYRAQISGNQFVNFADASPKVSIDAAMTWRLGRDIGDEGLMGFALDRRMANPSDRLNGSFNHHGLRILCELFLEDGFRSLPAPLPTPLPQNVWLPDLQVMISREQAGSNLGFFLAAKGGDNGESHNHNDVGNFIVYHDGLPVLIDVGCGTYTRRTFAPEERYTLWNTGSDYHNLPTINGRTQSPGRPLRATGVTCENRDAAQSRLSLDIAAAYQKEAGVERWSRSMSLDRVEGYVEITDTFRLANAPGAGRTNLVWSFMTCHPANVSTPGEVIISGRDTKGRERRFFVHYDSARMAAFVEKIALTQPEDEGVKTQWGDSIHRIKLHALSPRANDSFRFRITADHP